MADFSNLGLHCAVADCNQKDFLPFICDCCNESFCLPHRSYAAHFCPSAGDKDQRAIVCPLCRKTIRLLETQDPNVEWERHTRIDCQPENYVKNKPTKKRCMAPGCKEVLRRANSHNCAQCGNTVCLAHRFPDSHECSLAGGWSPATRGHSNATATATAAAATAVGEQARVAAVAVGGAGLRRHPSLREKAAARKLVNAAEVSQNTVRATADRRRRAAGQGRGGGRSRGGMGAAGGSEVCPQCGAGFDSVALLVTHVEAAHSYSREVRVPSAGTGLGW
ncbi:unnamed protein product [Discosporangium mesarthrocarpum]